MSGIRSKALTDLLREVYSPERIRRGEALALAQGILNVTVEKSHDDDDDWHVEARITGSGSKPFEVEMDIYSDPELGIDIDQYCSCRVGSGCEHGAAVLCLLATNPARWFGAAPSPSPSETNLPARSTRDVATARASPPAPRLDASFLGWLKELKTAAQAPETSPAPSQASPTRILFALKPQQGRLLVNAFQGRSQPSQNGWMKIGSISWSRLAAGSFPGLHLDPEDRDLLRHLITSQHGIVPWEVVLPAENGADLLRGLLKTQRCFWHSATKSRAPLRLGEARLGVLGWAESESGIQQPCLIIDPPAPILLPLQPPWYLDPVEAVCGPVETGHPGRVAAAWLKGPAVRPEQAGLLAQRFQTEAGESGSLPPPQAIAVETVHDAVPVPCLTLVTVSLNPSRRATLWEPDTQPQKTSLANLSFRYGSTTVPWLSTDEWITEKAAGCVRRIARNRTVEIDQQKRLAQLGMVNAVDAFPLCNLDRHRGSLTVFPTLRWFEFVQKDVPELRNEGWLITEDPSFDWRLATIDDWFADATSERRSETMSPNDWFGVELGVIVDGDRVNILPLILELLRNDRSALDPSRIDARGLSGIPLRLPDGRAILFPVERARAMQGILLDLFDGQMLGKGNRIRLDRLRTAQLAGEADWRWLGPSELNALGQRLRDFRGLESVPPPAGLKATLRPYQQEGLNWLQFLRQYDFAGVLADDMGLGKTIQALAHLLAEREAGRADRPSLVVAPTSLMTNWRQETERFAPDLRVLVLHGLDRHDHFDKIPAHDLVLTTYPLLPRDLPRLQSHQFHLLILDEAQFIKNPKTAAAQAAVQLKARHRLCLTGTPMENHLGELWSLFHFLLPGFLGDELAFNRVFRRPIEKNGDASRRGLLARRVAPFLLRRRKDEVARELPPKTEIVQNIELADAQRDLYESVRLAMHARVKEEVARKGLSRAHIVILDALLKLRQICCHPQLLSLPAAKNVHESAKLERLLELLPPLLEDGRRVLLFSQFTSMLALIERELQRASIPFSLLTGDTQDRATPIRSFQEGKVPVFLISLKAGGTGLNLTAADTVIHYDPWWNPAVENQATDRAHRIGQDKQVFVYKLLTVGTVEEKIAALQERKKELVAGLLDDDRRDKLSLTSEDIDSLFAPIR